MAICRCSGTCSLRCSTTSRAELVLDLGIELDLINRTGSCQGRGVTPTYSSCALILGANPTTGRIPMSEFTVTRTLKGRRERVWQVLTLPSHFEGWLPAKSGTAVLDVRTGGSWQATVISSGGDEIALT